MTTSDSAIAIRDQPRRSNWMIVMRAPPLSLGAMHDSPSRKDRQGSPGS